MYSLNIGVPKFIRQTLVSIKENSDHEKIIVGFSVFHSHQQTENPGKKIKLF
jgi:hypothetical protein